MNENANLNNNEAAVVVELTAGEMLRNARTTGRRKREIPTISKQLCIREEFLQALEDGDYAAIPEQVYILGFARNYAMELGLNPDEVVAKIKREMGIVPEGGVEDTVDSAAARTAGANKKVPMMAGIVRFVRGRWKLVAAGGVAVLALVVAIIMLIMAGGASSDNVDAQPTQIEQVQSSSEPRFTKTVRERFGVENRDNARIILQSLNESWVKIEDGRGSTVFSRVLVPGDIYYVPKGSGYKATFGNAGGVDIWVDGTLVDKAGAPHTRKSGVAMDPDALIKTASAAKKEADDQKEDTDSAAE